MKTNLKNPCDDCPFRNQSLPGWLGPWTAQGLAQSVMDREEPFICHQTMGTEEDEDKPIAEMSLCKGSILFLKKNFKMPYSPFLREQLKLVTSEETSNILNRQEFINHHERSK